jgi:hypothetical protein
MHHLELDEGVVRIQLVGDGSGNGLRQRGHETRAGAEASERRPAGGTSQLIA